MTRDEALVQAQAALEAEPAQVAQLIALEESYPGITEEAALENHRGDGLEGLEAFPLQPEPNQDTLVDAQVDVRWSIPSDAIHKPSSLADLVAVVQQAVDTKKAIRPLGSGYSQSDVTDPPDDNQVVSTALLGRLLPPAPAWAPSTDKSTLYRCEAGRTVGQIIADLDAGGLGLPNMGAGTFQAVMGAIQTCTHGSGVTLPAFPDMVMAMTWVTVENGKAVVYELEREGDLALSDPTLFEAGNRSASPPIRLIQSDDLFNAAVVSMGTMGIAYSVTLRVVTQYWLMENRTVEWWSALDLEAELEKNIRNFELLIDPWPRTNPNTNTSDHQILVTRRTLVKKKANQTKKGSRPILMALAKTSAGRLTAGIAFTMGMKNPLNRVPKNLNTGIHSTAVSGYRRKSYEVLLLQLDVNAVAEEVGVPVARATEAANTILDLARKSQKTMKRLIGDTKKPFKNDIEALKTAWRTAALHTSPFSLRFVRKSDAWVAMPYQQDMCMIEMPMTGTDHLDSELRQGQSTTPSDEVQVYKSYIEGRQNLWRSVEQALAPMAVRPHWGLWNSVGPAEAAQRYPKWSSWCAKVRTYNATGAFDSPFTTRMGLSARDDASDGALRGDVVLRVTKKMAYLKVKDAPGWAIYNGLTAAPERNVIIKGKKRKGVKVIGSTADLADPVVAEFHFDTEGTLVKIDGWDLFHSLTVERQLGTATLDGKRLVISGDAATRLRGMLIAGGRTGPADGDVVLQQGDPTTGTWTLVDPPR
ncbi:MAG: FAD/FMN-containing dehydrogenase [Myxococcota bacterium]|jgi:FAD/FMN-containing dehydrogenase